MSDKVFFWICICIAAVIWTWSIISEGNCSRKWCPREMIPLMTSNACICALEAE